MDALRKVDPEQKKAVEEMSLTPHRALQGRGKGRDALGYLAGYMARSIVNSRHVYVARILHGNSTEDSKVQPAGLKSTVGGQPGSTKSDRSADQDVATGRTPRRAGASI